MRTLGVVRCPHSRKERLSEVRVACGPTRGLVALLRLYREPGACGLARLPAALHVGIMCTGINTRLVAGAAGAVVHIMLELIEAWRCDLLGHSDARGLLRVGTPQPS